MVRTGSKNSSPECLSAGAATNSGQAWKSVDCNDIDCTQYLKRYIVEKRTLGHGGGSEDDDERSSTTRWTMVWRERSNNEE